MLVGWKLNTCSKVDHRWYHLTLAVRTPVVSPSCSKITPLNPCFDGWKPNTCLLRTTTDIIRPPLCESQAYISPCWNTVIHFNPWFHIWKPSTCSKVDNRRYYSTFNLWIANLRQSLLKHYTFSSLVRRSKAEHALEGGLQVILLDPDCVNRKPTSVVLAEMLYL